MSAMIDKYCILTIEFDFRVSNTYNFSVTTCVHLLCVFFLYVKCLCTQRALPPVVDGKLQYCKCTYIIHLCTQNTHMLQSTSILIHA